MKSSVAARGCERAAVQDMRLGMEPRTPVGARLSPQFAVCPYATVACDSGDRLRPFKSFSGKQIARF